MKNLDRLKYLFSLDRKSGELFWKNLSSPQSRIVAGDRAGSLRPDGYRTVRVDGKPTLEHRVVWALSKGYWPEHELDHVNGIRHDNRPSNLRASTRTGNNRNTSVRVDNTSGRKGVYWEKSSGKWKAQISVEGKRINLGRFKDLTSASEAYSSAAKKYFGEFARIENPI